MEQQVRDEEFSAYVLAHRSRLVRTARLLTAGDQDAAEDVVQTALTRLYVHWPRVRKADDPVGYGFRALTNAFLDDRRRAHHRREVPADATPEVASPVPDQELALIVLQALEGLAPRQRAVVVLRHFLQYDVAAAAQALGCSEGTVKSQNAKALAHLRTTLGPSISVEGTNR
jgi:RNA polymerase sigma-70 factor (sigma-E family)